MCIGIGWSAGSHRRPATKSLKEITVILINVYAPYRGRSTEESEACYDTLQQTIQRLPTSFLFISRDFNAKIGQRREGDAFLILCSQEYRNECGIRLRVWKTTSSCQTQYSEKDAHAT